jgi:hypothetical protein
MSHHSRRKGPTWRYAWQGKTQERETESANPRRRPQTHIEAAVAAVPRPSHPLSARCRSPRTSSLPTEAATTIHGGAPSSSLRGDGGPKDGRNFFEARATFLTLKYFTRKTIGSKKNCKYNLEQISKVTHNYLCYSRQISLTRAILQYNEGRDWHIWINYLYSN